MCGLPAAGKTSITENLKASPPSQVVCSCVCFDEVERAKGGYYGSEQALTFDAMAWKKARESAMSEVEQELHSAAASSQDCLVIVDDNMYYRHQAVYIQLYIRCPVETATQRNASRSQNQRVPEAVMHRMARMFEVPDPQKHAWESNTIVLDSSRLEKSFVSNTIWQQILGMWKDPVQLVADAATLEQTRQDGQAANKLSLQHQLDLFCRKAVSETMQQLKADKGVDQHQLASTAQSLNAARQAALATLRASAQSDSQAECERQQVAFRKQQSCTSQAASTCAVNRCPPYNVIVQKYIINKTSYMQALQTIIA
ncbi:hypothetical protein WJX82_001058 [Trebouxia sp. C0006]